MVGARVLTVNTIGDLTELGQIVAGSLTGRAGGNVSLARATAGNQGEIGNQIASIGGFAAPNGTFTLQNSRTLQIAGPLTAGSDVTLRVQSGAGTPSLAEGAGSGDLLVSGSIAGATVALTAYRDVRGGTAQAAGTVAVLAGRTVDLAITAATVTGAAGQDFAVSGDFDRAQSVSAVNGSLRSRTMRRCCWPATRAPGRTSWSQRPASRARACSGPAGRSACEPMPVGLRNRRVRSPPR